MKILRILFITILFFVVKTVVAIAVEQKLPDDLYSEQKALQVFQEKFEAEYKKLQAKKDQEGNQLTEEEIAKIQSMYDALVLKNMQFFEKIQNIAP